MSQLFQAVNKVFSEAGSQSSEVPDPNDEIFSTTSSSSRRYQSSQSLSKKISHVSQKQVFIEMAKQMSNYKEENENLKNTLKHLETMIQKIHEQRNSEKLEYEREKEELKLKEQKERRKLQWMCTGLGTLSVSFAFVVIWMWNTPEQSE
uniref:Uncharacterized protein n=1 Tax=Timspurckia oligopyrenoides TaxID=708627 RepID=A0A7S0ZEM2_9RHOD|mmetsp:Transcript_2243/g.3949  ORF Transcript_2243/g.3949 Transcript_2243/m.3949 type:complete len:149 (+) Transcript_2243:61-507(+)